MVAFNLGLVHLTVNQDASAFHFFSAAVNLKPTFAPALGLLGVTLHRLGDLLNATMAFEKALQINASVPCAEGVGEWACASAAQPRCVLSAALRLQGRPRHAAQLHHHAD